MDALLKDLRTAVRTLRSAPLATAVAAVTIALGVGATTTIFGVGNAILLRTPVGVRDSDALVSVHRIAEDGSSFHAFSHPDFRDMQRAAGLTDLVAFMEFPASVGTEGEPVLEMGVLVSANYFRLLGTRPALGRFFVAEEDVGPGGARVVVLSHAAWQTRFHGDTSVVGRAVTINGQPFTVVGVAERGFGGHITALPVAMWVPLALQPVVRGGMGDFLDNRRSVGLEFLGRLAPGSSARQAGEALGTIWRQGAVEAGAERTRGVDVRPYAPVPAPALLPMAGFLGVMLVLAALVLLIASANVANVLLARAAARTREIAVRLAIGASRGRLVRLLVTETMLLFLLGGLGGTLIAAWATGALERVNLPFPLPVAFDFGLDLRVLGAALAVVLATGLVFGLAPALQATRPDLMRSLKDEAGVVRIGRMRLRGAFVTAQVAGTTLLLVVAGLFVRALARAGEVDLGFDPAPLHAVSFEFRATNYDPERVIAFAEELERTVGGLPGVVSVGSMDMLPINFGNQQTRFAIDGRPSEPDVGQFSTDFAVISPGYLATIGIPLLRGRDFGPADRRESPSVALVNEALAQRAWPGEDPVGKLIRFGDDGAEATRTLVVGVVRNAKVRSIGERETRSMLYLPMRQEGRTAMTLLLRMAPGQVVPTDALRRAVRAIDPALPVGTSAPYPEILALSLLPNRIAVLVAALFGTTGLVLATVGLYGVLSYMVQRRRREIGIRLALGAAGAHVRTLVLREGLRLTGLGLLLGLGVAAGVTRLLGALLYGLSPLDPLTYGGIAVVMLGTAWLACAGPMRRALRTEPLEVLRHD